MCYQSVKLMETSLVDDPLRRHHHQAPGETVLSPVAAVVQVVQAGRRAFEPQRVINDYHADDSIILRFAQPSNAFIKTYSKDPTRQIIKKERKKKFIFAPFKHV